MIKERTRPPQEGEEPGLDERLRSLGRGQEGVDPAAFEALEAALAGEGGLGRLRALPGRWRAAIALGVAAALVGGVCAATILGGSPHAWTPRLWVSSAALGVLVVATVGLSLWPLHRPEPPRWMRRGVWAAAMALPLGMALAPPERCFVLEDSTSMVEGLLGAEAACFLMGIFVALPVLAVWALVQRAARWQVSDGLMIASAAALTGFLSLELHCGISERGHLMLGHFGAVVAFVAAIGGVVLLRR